MGFGKDGKGAIIKELTLVTIGALGSNDVVKAAGPVITEDFRIIKTEVSCTLTALTAGEGTGASLGIANNDLSAAEIEESLEVTGPLFPGDRILQEKAERFTKILGEFVPGNVNTQMLLQGPDGGSPVSATIRWTFGNSQAGWGWFVYNNGAAITTGATAVVRAVHYGVWVV